MFSQEAAMSRIFLSSFLFCVAACGATTAPRGGEAQSGDAGSRPDSTLPMPDGSVPPEASVVRPSGPPVTVTGSATIGPISLAAGEERTVCITVPLNNELPIMATELKVSLAQGSHHLIAYRSVETSPSPTPVDCAPLGGITSGTAPILIAQKDGDILTFPSGVGFPMPAHQMVKIEAHYINTTRGELAGQGTFTATGPDGLHATSLQTTDLAFWGTLGIKLPPHASSSSGIRFQKAIAGTHGFAVTTHQHRLGTRFRVWASKDGADITDSSPALADNTTWDEPKTYQLSPTLDFDGSNGLAFQCEWNNTTDSAVDFGESALNEMCFMWMYYYPSHGFDACLNGCSR
jgi:hypothetical protein